MILYAQNTEVTEEKIIDIKLFLHISIYPFILQIHYENTPIQINI